MAKYDYDVCVIGCGPAGFAAAMRCWDFGKKVCLIEKSSLGGAGIHHGALSSKTLWELSRDYQGAVRQDRGYVAENVKLNYNQVVSCVQRAIEEKEGHLRYQLRELEEPTPDFPGSVTLLEGSAKFVEPHRIEIEVCKTGLKESLSAEHFVVATGSSPRNLESIPIDGKKIMTSDHILALDRFPKSLVILGAGVVGCEFATIFANYGRSKVNLIDRADRILPFEDEDIARICSANLEAKGVTIHHRAQLISMEVVGDSVEYTIQHHSGGKEKIQVDHALISIGRVPNTEGLGLEEVGVELDPQGYIVAKNTQSTVPHIYGAGDVTRNIALVNVGELEARYAAESICGAEMGEFHTENLSSIMFLDPEVAAIGMNEMQAQENKIPYYVATYDYSLVNRAIAMRATEGFVKLLVTADDQKLMLGMRALGVHASTTIEAASLIIQHKRSALDLAELIHPHPAITEVLQDCVRMLSGSSIFKPHVFKTKLRLSKIEFD